MSDDPTHEPPPQLPEDVADRLQALARLRDRGALSPEAYEAARATLLDANSARETGDTPSPAERPWAWEPSNAGQPSPEPPAPEPAGDEPIPPEPGPPLPPPVETPPEPPGELVPPPPMPGTVAPGSSQASSAIPPPLPLPGLPPPSGPPTAPPPPLALGSGWQPPQRERYPMHFEVDYPDRLSRWKTLLRIFLILPVYLVLPLVQYFAWMGIFVGWTAVFWRKKYPGWVFDGVSGGFAYQARAAAYFLLLTDKFPSFSKESNPVTLVYDEPPSGKLSRWRVFFWKLVLLIPHFFVLYLISVALFAVTAIAWFGILFTGNYPRGLFQFSVGVQRWYWRVMGYFASFNDRFPPYALSADAPTASNGATVANGVIGGLIAAGFTTLIVVGALIGNDYETHEVDYARLLNGQGQVVSRFKPDFSDGEVLLRLTRVTDPGNDLVEVIRPGATERVIVFQWTVVNGTGQSQPVAEKSARLSFSHQEGRDTEEDSVRAIILAVNNSVAPTNVRDGGSATVQAVFIVPSDAEPLELRFSGGFAGAGVRYVFE